MINGPTLSVLYWLVGLAVVWLLWRPASRAYFRPPGYTQAQHHAQMAEFDYEAQMAELARIRSSRARQAAERYAIPGKPKWATWVSLAILMVIILGGLWALPPN
jgi:hypothetical protein